MKKVGRFAAVILSIAVFFAVSQCATETTDYELKVAGTSDSVISASFEEQPKGVTSKKTFSLQNTGDAELEIDKVTITGDDADQFEVTQKPGTISPGETEKLTIEFKPTTTGVKNAVVSMQNNTDTDIKIILTGSSTRFAIYLLMGQSNMVGRATISADPDQIAHPRVFQMDRSTDPLADMEWITAVDPLKHNGTSSGVGPGLTFGKTMADGVSQYIEIGLIPTARGGTGITEWEQGDELYEDAKTRALEAINRGDGKIMGALWLQGERDSQDIDNANAYADRLKILVESLRQDLGVPDLPFI
jgi:hypothetical protein